MKRIAAAGVIAMAGAFLAAGTAAGRTPDGVEAASSTWLLRYCLSLDMKEQLTCDTAVFATIEAHSVLVGVTKSRPLYCMPADTPPQKVKEAFALWAADHVAEADKQSFTTGIFRALRAAYPCQSASGQRK